MVTLIIAIAVGIALAPLMVMLISLTVVIGFWALVAGLAVGLIIAAVWVTWNAPFVLILIGLGGLLGTGCVALINKVCEG